jgi:hypothetical protein
MPSSANRRSYRHKPDRRTLPTLLPGAADRAHNQSIQVVGVHAVLDEATIYIYFSENVPVGASFANAEIEFWDAAAKNGDSMATSQAQAFMSFETDQGDSNPGTRIKILDRTPIQFPSGKFWTPPEFITYADYPPI